MERNKSLLLTTFYTLILIHSWRVVSCQRPIVNSSTAAITQIIGSAAPSIVLPTSRPRSDIAQVRDRPGSRPQPVEGANSTISRNPLNPRAGKFLDLKNHLKNQTQYWNTINRPYHTYERDPKFSAMDRLRKDFKTSLTNGHNVPIAEQKDTPNSQEYDFRDPITELKKNFPKQPYNYMPMSDNSDSDYRLGIACDFESECNWSWEQNAPDSFRVVSGIDLTDSNRTGMMPGPYSDGSNNAAGHFLYLKVTPNTTQSTLTSPTFSSTRENCYLEVLLHQSNMEHSSMKTVIVPQNQHKELSTVSMEITGNNNNKWHLHAFTIGRVSKEFQIVFEVIPKLQDHSKGHVAIDNMRLIHCFPEGAVSETCMAHQVKCNSSKIPVCIKRNRICDIDRDCDLAEDENLNCDKMPFGSRCDFEDGWCGWANTGRAMLDWNRHSGPTPTDKTGPEMDHTYLYDEKKMGKGHYMFVNMAQHVNESKIPQFASNAVLNSPIFNPPPKVHSNATSPFRNSCMARYFIHQFGPNPGSINFSVVEMKEKENITTTLWWNSRSLGEEWIRIEQLLPSITSRYFLQFEARMGMRIFSDVALDDFSLSPECFGLNIPEEHLDGYNYWDPYFGLFKEPHIGFKDKKFLELTNCGARGRFGPSLGDCQKSYNGTDVLNQVRINEKAPFNGTQVWTVPNDGWYTVIAKGAGGGLGSAGVGSSRGASVMSVIHFNKGEEIIVLVGQPGEHACIKSIGKRDESCEPKNSSAASGTSKVHMIKKLNISDGSGGGGGASYIFLLNSARTPVPLLVAGGGGGLGIGTFNDDIQHGRIMEEDPDNRTGRVIDSHERKAGAGGGWMDNEEDAFSNMTGMSLLSGAIGGVACYQRGIHGHGGFGGGGGGCFRGGAAGGFAGGASLADSNNGQGGTSFLLASRAHETLSNIVGGANSGTGSVIIIPAIEDCGCIYLCVALDEYRSDVACICPTGQILNPLNLTQCDMVEDVNPHDGSVSIFFLLFIIVSCALLFAFGFLMVMLYNRYQRKKQIKQRHKMLLEQDLQLSRLRNTPDNITSPSVNIDYGCDGIINGNVDVKSLPQVARESLRLIKALGQGAFGEVYQGLYKHRDGDTVEMPVAVKTLPEMSTGQAESDFLMEAAIMAKFNHPNIVHLIGVCFDRHPRFIVLELLAGGDLKNFLREGRNKPERPSPLTMKDLIFCALDVAKGCRYLESKRFIHRDIAARNCLLSSKGPGRVVKIADFGMARDIYRSDYYRKGGKAMLPIKWMPPEAFLDGLFTSKTDVWSFGVLLWEVFSLGLMPYTGLPNRDVMQLVTGGGRLDSPPGCPAAIYRVMSDCWNPTPELRPSFSNLLERLTACSQDTEIMNAPLPSFFRPVSSNERDTTIMRPPGHDDFCLQVPNSDYLIPLQGPRSAVERLLNEATGVTIPDSLSTMTAPTTVMSELGKNRSWETSFSIPKSQVNGHEKLHKESSTERLISLDTPQQTPTAIQPPPLSFGTPLSAALNNHLHDHDDTSGVDTNGALLNGPIKQQPITLDPLSLNDMKQGGGVTGGTSYANVKMMNNANNLSELQDKISSNNNSTSSNMHQQAPFTIQGFNDRYNNLPKNDNHSEISC